MVEKKISLLKIADIKIHRFYRKKMAELFPMKNIFFAAIHRNSYIFFDKPSTRDNFVHCTSILADKNNCDFKLKE